MGEVFCEMLRSDSGAAPCGTHQQLANAEPLFEVDTLDWLPSSFHVDNCIIYSMAL
jgi:hypothetical protein